MVLSDISCTPTPRSSAAQMKIKLLVLFLLLIGGCKNKSDIAEKPVDELAADSDFHGKGDQVGEIVSSNGKHSFPLDSLLTFNSEEQLKLAFGGDVTRSIGYVPEGMGQYPNTLLFAGTRNEVEFIWGDTTQFTDLLEVNVFNENSDWATPEGITMGTALKELEQFNKKPFKYYGFGWDYSGTVNWLEGHLFERGIFVCLRYPLDQTVVQYDSLLGDQEIKSDSALSQRANPVVVQLSMRTMR